MRFKAKDNPMIRIKHSKFNPYLNPSAVFRGRRKKMIGGAPGSLIPVLGLAIIFLFVFSQPLSIEKDNVQYNTSLAKPDKTEVRFLEFNEYVESNRHLSDYREVWERELFRKSIKQPEPETKNTKPPGFPVRGSADRMKLVGVVLANTWANRVAVIENNGAQRIYREGDPVGKLFVKQILRDQVIVGEAGGDTLMRLALDRMERGTVASATAVQRAPETIQLNTAGGRFKTVQLAREEITAALNDVDDVLRNAGTRSYQYGMLTGFRIGRVSDESILKKIGLRSHDVILAVNNKSSENEQFAFMEQISGDEPVTIKYRRRNRTRLIDLIPM